MTTLPKWQADLAALPDRCSSCGCHPKAQGHLAPCPPSGPLHDRLLIEGRGLAQSGMAATVSAHPDDASLVDRVLAARIKRGGRFSLNDLRPQLRAVRSRSVIGARVNAAARRGEIRRVDYTPSTDPGTHGHPVAVWEAA